DSLPRLAARGTYYRGGPVDLAELIARWHRAGAVDGFQLVPIAPHRDLERLVNGTVALLQHRSLFRAFHPGGTLREHLGLTRLTRPANRRALTGGTV
ncbi:LLM class flavin-dependent oxidoreductase, partial [Streptomyces sp. NPDC055078]